MDFGRSLWRSDQVRDEWPGLASRNFEAAGQFGIGFFAVFMLGDHVEVNTRRHSRHADESTDQWTLIFDSGAKGRPLLRESSSGELLLRAGTRVSVRVSLESAKKIFEQLHAKRRQFDFDPDFELIFRSGVPPEVRKQAQDARAARQGKPWLMSKENFGTLDMVSHWAALVGWLCPASEVALTVAVGALATTAVQANDWQELNSQLLLKRLFIEHEIPLLPLIDKDGSLRGRVGLATMRRNGECVLVHGGLRCGKIDGFVGVALSGRPSDIRRMEASADADPQAWQQWTRSLFQSKAAVDIRQLRMLQAFDPTNELPVVVAGGQPMTFSQCATLAATSEQLIVVYNEMTTLAWDPVEFGMFGAPSAPFLILRNVWLAPRNEGYVPKPLEHRIKNINYQSMLESLLTNVWGGFSAIRDSDTTIGSVAGKPIYRDAWTYTRKHAAQ